MTAPEIASDVVTHLDKLGVEYMVVGSFSTNLYGIPRSTRDLDVVVNWGSRTVRELTNELGSKYQLDPQLSFEMVTMTIRNIVAVPESDFKVELFHLSEDDHDVQRFSRRKRVPFAGVSAFVASPEDVVITKLNWYARQKRGRDRDDARNVLAVQGDALDFAYINSWCDRHGTRALLDEIRASIPPID